MRIRSITGCRAAHAWSFENEFNYDQEMSKLLAFFTLTVLSFYQPAEAQMRSRNIVHEATPQEWMELRRNPKFGQRRYYPGARNVDWVPSPDTANFRYVLMSSETNFQEAANLRYTIAKNLPANVILVLLVDSYNIEKIKKTYSQYISLDRVIFAKAQDISGGFWARDAFPYPVIRQNGDVGLVQANYYRYFAAGAEVAKSVNLGLAKYDFTFVGGNLLADERGNCFTVLSPRMFDTKIEDLQAAYGCRTVKAFKHLRGIGDVDEVIKPLGNGKVLTNTPEYAAELKQMGYQPIMLPEIPRSYRTYANSLVVGQTVFMPVYGMATDEQAKKVYEGLGYKVIGIPSNTLSDNYRGSVHCQVMAYPSMNKRKLFDALRLTEVK